VSASYEQLPGTLNLTMRAGDEFSALVDFSISLAGYAVHADIVSVVSGAVVGSLNATLYDAASGQVNLSLPESSALPAGTYRWLLYWDAPGSVRRTALAGFLEVRA